MVLKTSGIRSFEDLEGRRLAVLGPNAFTGNAVALGEVARRGEDPDKYFSALVPAWGSMAVELETLRRGEADAAVLRTCYLEDMKARGEKMDDLAPVAVRPESGVTCLASPELYPNWTLFATPRATPPEARLAAAALLSMPPDAEGRRWGVASDFSTVDALYRSIRQGPYAYLRSWSWRRFWEEYWGWILAALAAHSAQGSHLVRVRTAQLERALSEQKKSEKKARAAIERIEALQKAGVVRQMSSIIAHELRQPLAAILAFSHGLLRLLDRPGEPQKELLEEGIEKIGAQASKADRIVQKVRSYARRPEAARVPFDLGRAVRDAVETVLAAKPWGGAALGLEDSACACRSWPILWSSSSPS